MPDEYVEFIKLVHAGQRAGKLATVGDLAEWLEITKRGVLSMAADCDFHVETVGGPEARAAWTVEDTSTNVLQCKACYGPIPPAGSTLADCWTWADHDVCSPRCYLLSHIDGMDAAAGETLQLAIEQFSGVALAPTV